MTSQSDPLLCAPTVGSGGGTLKQTLVTLLQYKAWANEIAFQAVLSIPPSEAFKPRATTFGNIAHTLNHVFIVDDVFRHRLEGLDHPYAARDTVDMPGLGELWTMQQHMDRWYANQLQAWPDACLQEVISFEFIGGGRGAMTRSEILLHLVNHATYHRGFVGDMLKHIPFHWKANDLTVFLRDREGNAPC